MAIEIIDGCKIYVNGLRSVIVNSDCISKCMDVYKKYNMDGVAVSIYQDYKLQDVDFLNEYPEIKHISISDGIADINAINTLSTLHSAIISGKNRHLDFSNFPELEVLTADWSPYFKNLGTCSRLWDLSLHHYTARSKNLSSISELFWIKKLKITQSNILNLHGLEEFNKLEEAEFNYCSKLEEICCLKGSEKSLTSLIFNHCKAIKNYNYVANLHKLKILAFNNCGPIPSIKFIAKMNSLEDFRFGDTDVIDGDMSSCIRLKYVYFSNKRHFSHKLEEVRS